MCLVSFKSQHNDKTRWSSAGFCFPVRLIGVKFAPSKTFKTSRRLIDSPFQQANEALNCTKRGSTGSPKGLNYYI